MGLNTEFHTIRRLLPYKYLFQGFKFNQIYLLAYLGNRINENSFTLILEYTNDECKVMEYFFLKKTNIVINEATN